MLRRGLSAACLTVVALAMCGAGAASAHVFLDSHGHYVSLGLRAGVNPHHLSLHTARSHAATPRFDAFGNMTYQSTEGPVMHGATFYSFYWTPPGETYPASSQALINQWMGDVAADSTLNSNSFAVAQQYTDTSGAGERYAVQFGGPLTDTTPYVNGCTDPMILSPLPTCITDAQIANELTSFVAAHGLPSGPNPIYHVFVPADVAVCVDATTCSTNVFCGYHSDTIGAGLPSTPVTAIPGNDILYAVIPLEDTKQCQDDGRATKQEPNGDAADIAVKVAGHEATETMNNPLGNAWRDINGAEIGDKCNGVGGSTPDPNSFAPVLGGADGSLFTQSINTHHYFLQSEWSNGESACRMTPSGPPPTAQFSAPPLAPPGSPVAFNAAASTAGAGISSYAWEFGDFGSAFTVAPAHAYATGTYNVRLTVIDRFGGSAAAVHPITIDRPPVSSFTSTPGPAGAQSAFNASSSSDPDGSVGGWSWNFGDGTSGAGPNTSHVYAAPGSYTVTLTVTDNSGSTAASAAKLQIAPPAPRTAFSLRTTKLGKIARKGLLVSYTANEAGRLRAEVIVSSRIARSLHLSGRRGSRGVIIAAASRHVAGAGTGRLTVRISHSAIAKLRRRRSVTASVRLTLTVLGGRRGTTAHSFRFKR